MDKIRAMIEDGYKKDIKDKISWRSPLVQWMGGPRAIAAFNHSLLRKPRKEDDLVSGKVPRVDVWQYQYKNPKTSEIITAIKPISTKKKYWKAGDEARIISMTLYGSIKKYYDGAIDFLNSIKYIKTVNKVDARELWGYESFITRVYVAQRKPSNSEMGPLENATDPAFIKMLLERGCEIALVDNHLDKVGRDATFWRFLVTDEQMEDRNKIRYLIRDVDHKVTAAEYFSVGEWIGTGIKFHRMHFATSFVGPLTAGIFGGTHEGKGGIKNIARLIEGFPYRLVYGDDEIFSKYIIWEHIKRSRSILTHKYERGISFKVANLYEGSSQDDPTYKYCEAGSGEYLDALMPKGILFPLIYLAYDVALKDLEEEYFNLLNKLHNPRVKRAFQNLYVKAAKTTRLVDEKECYEAQGEPGIFEMYRQIKESMRLCEANK